MDKYSNVLAIVRPKLAGQTLPIGGNLVTGEEIAAAISLKINQNLNFIEVPINEFENQLKPGFGELAVQEISNLYRFVRKNHSDFTDKGFQKTNKLLGVTPQSLSGWFASVNWNN